MGDFGTGLRQHLEQSRTPGRSAPPPLPVDPHRAEVEAERRRLEQLAAELAGRELALAERELELEATEARLAHTLAKALIDAAKDSGVPPPVDELAAARARRRPAW